MRPTSRATNFEQFVVAHFGQQRFAILAEQLVGHVPACRDHGVDPLFHRAAADELMDQHVPFLADAKGPVGGLVLDGRIPPAIEVNDVRRRGQIQPAAAGLERDDEKRRPDVAS